MLPGKGPPIERVVYVGKKEFHEAQTGFQTR